MPDFLTLLGADRGIAEDELPVFYDYPDIADGSWLRANFIASLDGGATAAGLTGGLGGSGDRAIFSMLRELADVVVVGAGTVRIEGYSGVRLGIGARQRRQARHQAEIPPLAIVTNAGHLDKDLGVFTRTEVPVLVLTCTAAADDTRHRLSGLPAEVIDCSADDPTSVDAAAILAHLRARGLRRVLTEGGPMLLGAFIDRGLLDELCLTIAPCIVGGSSPRIVTGPGQVMTQMRCAHVITDDAGYLYTRYVRE
ncbi:hypothetical protein BST27_17240 [Mycobacterium intermedium]|uniref:Bacterial bifunctional deaminase-reductase C-terminal domain-containing protein n=1 Tax=Mycobacterium intermedium TaxID=28445 RepID=A0A1E3SDW7_MYCIE|nr:pyrimidine reductase family protein [Mycobacterium intermedium]MCV6965955.1 pyrimidine reductase family protein [Mycobacterium intermedium]ODR00366.1 hypothetical protein BHQ20_13520 [Mycobacterium intermedium]OPE51071.1 hypothetical protein BV508_07885 [Mycobacterium intermedium]ORB01755.1 hypothetical protein BST27_17240 [Mycobacterium intermedium]